MHCPGVGQAPRFSAWLAEQDRIGFARHGHALEGIDYAKAGLFHTADRLDAARNVAAAQAFQRRSRLLLAALVELPPAVEAARQARGDLWVEAVEPANLLGEEVVAAAVGGMKTDVVVADGVLQGVDLVRLRRSKAG